MSLLDDLKVSRRHALKGILSGVGVSLWLPVLDVMCNENGTAFAQGAAFPTTFGIFFWGNGVHPGPLWTPLDTGDGDAWKLPPNLGDFADLKDDMTLVTGLYMMDGVFKGHGWGVVYVLAGGDGTICKVIADIAKSPYNFLVETAEGTQWMPTIDQLVANAIHTSEPFKSLETGILKYTGLNMGTVSLNLAHTAPNKPLPPERDPAALFNKLMSAGAPPSTGSGTPIDVSNKLRRSVLDALLVEAKRLQMRVGSADAKRLDAHMESIRSLERSIPATSSDPQPPGPICRAPAAPTAQAANVDLTKVSAASTAVNQLIATALSCNMTRVYSHLWSGARDDNYYPVINVDSGHMTLTHNHDDSAQTKAAQIEKYIMSQYASLAKTLKDTPMGASNLLENTVIYGISELADPAFENMRDYHVVLMGHAGGKIKGNRHYREPGRKVTELMLTLQQVMGMNVTTFGSWDKTSTTMPEILA